MDRYTNLTLYVLLLFLSSRTAFFVARSNFRLNYRTIILTDEFEIGIDTSIVNRQLNFPTRVQYPFTFFS